MPRIIVISDPVGDREGVVTLEERVVPAHLEDDHSAAQLIERAGWAILDAEEAEIAGSGPPSRVRPAPRLRGGPPREGPRAGRRESAFR